MDNCFTPGGFEAGCDEAGRGCLAGPVVAAAVVLPDDFHHPWLNDSKQVTRLRREALRPIIEREAIAWGVGICTPEEIDKLNILRASITAMHRALDLIAGPPCELSPCEPFNFKSIIVDGNRFYPYRDIPFTTFVKGDGRYANIAAASILAKTHRDEIMDRLHSQYPAYNWASNKGYPTPDHREAILRCGPSPHHRLSFRLLPPRQLELF